LPIWRGGTTDLEKKTPRGEELAEDGRKKEKQTATSNPRPESYEKILLMEVMGTLSEDGGNSYKGGGFVT